MSSKEDEDPQLESSEGEEEDEDMDSDMEEEQSRKRLKELDAILEQDPYHYQSYIDKIEIFSKLGELEDLRKVREQFSQQFPLSPDIWISWLKDEQSLIVSDENKDFVFNLFERAVKDYVSVDLWLEYCQFSLCGISNPDGVKKTRNIFERAVAAVGIHVAKGSLIWEAYREFEAALFSLTQNENEKKEQKSKIRKLFQRQLTVPLLDLDSTVAEFKTFEEGEVERSILQKTKKMVEEREEYENKLLQTSGEDHLNVYSEYLQIEIKSGIPARIQGLYERRITDHCLVPSVWIEYLRYLTDYLKVEDVILDVHQRSVRNCPWEAPLWISYLRSMERFKKSIKDVNKVFEKSLSCGFSDPSNYLDIWLCYIDFRLRKTREVDNDLENGENGRKAISDLFGRAVEHLVGVGGDLECKMARYWATMEGDHFKNMEEARKIWSDVMAVLGDKAKFWLEYINLEKLCGDSKHLRKLFPKALEKCTDFPESIGEVWMQFEREEGYSLEDFEKAEKRIEERIEKVKEIRAAEREALNAKMEKKKERDKDKRREKRHLESERKRKNPGERSQVPEKRFKCDSEGFKVPTMAPPGFKPDAEGTEKSKDIKAPPGFNASVKPPPGFHEEPTTVFLSNLDYSVTEERIKETMSKSGDVTEVRLVKSPNGKSKGFAYIVFSSKTAAENALKRDNEPLDGRPMFISPCDPDKKTKGHHFKYSKGLEKNKLFVKGLPLTHEKADLEEIFSPYGKIKEIRIVTYRNGHSKGIAFVEFETDQEASAAIFKTDGLNIGKKTLSVALSNPPERRTGGDVSKSTGQSDIKPLKTGPKTQVSFIPSALRRPTSKQSENGKKNDDEMKPKSNAEFRKFLLAGNK